MVGEFVVELRLVLEGMGVVLHLLHCLSVLLGLLHQGFSSYLCSRHVWCFDLGYILLLSLLFVPLWLELLSFETSSYIGMVLVVLVMCWLGSVGLWYHPSVLLPWGHCLCPIDVHLGVCLGLCHIDLLLALFCLGRVILFLSCVIVRTRWIVLLHLRLQPLLCFVSCHCGLSIWGMRILGYSSYCLLQLL